jgi:hypothetical protein
MRSAILTQLGQWSGMDLRFDAYDRLVGEGGFLEISIGDIHGIVLETEEESVRVSDNDEG